jgi:hypothetical protein
MLLFVGDRLVCRFGWNGSSIQTCTLDDQNEALQCFVLIEVLWSHESEKVSKQMDHDSNNLLEC